MSARKFTARDDNGVMLTANDASSGLTIADNGNASFSGSVTANGTTLTGDQDLSAYATLASPELTGSPTAPTATTSTNSTIIAFPIRAANSSPSIVNGATDATRNI